MKVKVKSLSRVRLFVTPWTVPARLLYPWDFPGKITRVGCHFLLQGIFPTQGSNLGLMHCRQILYHLNHSGAQRAISEETSKRIENSCVWELDSSVRQGLLYLVIGHHQAITPQPPQRGAQRGLRMKTGCPPSRSQHQQPPQKVHPEKTQDEKTGY